MCGIAGILHSGATDFGVQRELVSEMTHRLAHRGPDGFGLWQAEFAAGSESATTITLGHRRLAILDLTEAGAQPMTSACGRWTIAFNGEIFNYLELRRELGWPDGSFRTATDTEVLLECCAAWGIERTLPRLIGMFAFALWDSCEGELWLARDRVGEKPLVYFRTDKMLAFASEIKALAKFHRSVLDPHAVEFYLALGYVPAPSAIFKQTAKLAPGHWARWKRGSLEVRRWWFPETAQTNKNGFDSADEMRGLIGDAVRLRLRSEVPIAMSLSGGIDSSVVASELIRNDAALHAFTVVFEGDGTDLPYARYVADQLGLRHEVIRAKPQTAAQSFDAMIRAYDEPFADSSAIPSLALALALKGRYKVVLNGDGGDEAFAGYPHYEFIATKQVLKRAAAAVGICDGSGPGVYIQSKTTFREDERRQLMNGHSRPQALASLLSSDEFLRAQPAGALKRALWTDRHLYLSNDLTYKTDVALSAAGIEGRSPLLDHRILERAQGIVPSALVRGREKKLLLRRAYRHRLPAQILDRPKHGFGSPVNTWLNGPLRDVVRESLPCPLLRAAAQSGARGQRLWTLLVFARWAQNWGAQW
jgi:asparagine synthase (glutamine-hydrolysing)